MPSLLERNKPLLLKVLFGILGIFTLYIIFYNLGKAPLDNWDEAWYGSITKNMILSSDFIIPHWNNTVLLDKAPLYMWLSAFFSIFFGPSEFSLRLTSAISAVTIIFLVTRHVYKKYGLLPSLVAYASIALNNLFIFRARSGNLDSFSTLLILVSYFVMLSKHKYRLPILALIFASLYLERTSFVLFPLGVFAIHELLFRSADIIKKPQNYLLFLLMFAALIGWWLLLGYQRVGKSFIDYYFFKSDQNTAHLTLNYFKLNYFSYTYYSLQRRLFYLFALGVILLISKLQKPEYFLQFLFALSLICFLSFSIRSYNWYLMPSTPFWSLIIGYAVYELIKIFKSFKMMSFLILLTVFYISYKTFTQNIAPVLTTISAQGEAESGKYLKTHTMKNDTIVRLDQLYPTMIYYSQRRVLVSPNYAATSDYFVSRYDLGIMIQNKKLHWTAGQKDPTDKFLEANPQLKYQRIEINPDEYILKIL